MLYLNRLEWNARLRIEIQSFMVRNFTTVGGAVPEPDETIAEVFVEGDERSRI